MCQKNSAKLSSNFSLSVKLAKLTIILIFFLFAECAAGSCLSYGHACWGAHGKRSDSLRSSPNSVTSTNEDLAKARLLLIKLIENPDLRYIKTKPVDILDEPKLELKSYNTRGQDNAEFIENLLSDQDTQVFNEATLPRLSKLKSTLGILDNRPSE